MRKFLFAISAVLCAAASLSAQPRGLISGRLASKNFPAVENPVLFNGDEGFFIDVPPNAIRLSINLTTTPPEANIDLYARFAQQPERTGSTGVVADYRSEGPTGTERIEITENSDPPLQGGRYFIAMQAGFLNPASTGFLLASIELSPGASMLTTVARSNFDNGLQDWSRNYPAPDPVIPGSQTGDPEAQLDNQPDPVSNSRALRFRPLNDGDYFVAPPKYLGNLGLLGSDARFEFDLRATSSTDASQPLDLRIMGGNSSTFQILDRVPGAQYTHYNIPLSGPLWRKLGGISTFEEVMANVLRIEIRGNFGGQNQIVFFDNFVLLGRIPAVTAPVISSFNEDADGWVRNRYDAPFLIPRLYGATEGDSGTQITWFGVGGNPGGHLLINEAGGEKRDYMIAPPQFHGDLLSLGPTARFEVDEMIQTALAAEVTVEYRIFGFGATFRYEAVGTTGGWTTFRAPLDPNLWVRVGGDASFQDTLKAVQRVEVSIDSATGPENIRFDNFRLTAPPAPTPQLRVEPELLTFGAIQGEAPPPGKPIAITATEGQLNWEASASVDWLILAPPSGPTPNTLVASVNTGGLPLGIHEGAIAFVKPGSADAPVTTRVRLTLLSPNAPDVNLGGIVNSANYAPNDTPGGELTGGIFVSIFGNRLADALVAASAIPLPLELGGSSVKIGGIPAPLVFVSGAQINAVVPQNLPGAVSEVIVRRSGLAGAAETVRLAAVRPLLFSQNSTGSGPGAVLNFVSATQARLNTRDDPARPRQVISIFGTGFGPTETFVPDGAAATGINRITLTSSASIGGLPVTPSYVGLAPGFAHLYQVNAEVPQNSPLGCSIPVRVTVGGVTSNEVTIAVTANAEPCL